MLTITTILFCGCAALIGGFVDAIAGGGGLMTVPALLISGVPPHLALGTNKVSAFLGTIVSLINFSRHHLVRWRLVIWGVAFSFAGSWFGSLLALHLESGLLGKIIVFLLPFAMAATLIPPKNRPAGKTPEITGMTFWILLPVVCVFIGLYDGFFGPGTGSFLILALHWIIRLDLLEASGTAKAFNLASNLSGAISFIWHGAIVWELGLTMAACLMLGNWLGSAFAIRVGARAVRRFLLISMLLLLVTLIYQHFVAPA